MSGAVAHVDIFINTGEKHPDMDKIAVFICYCDFHKLDTEPSLRLSRKLEGLPGIVHVGAIEKMCMDGVGKVLVDTIAENKADGVVFTSCSPDLHREIFDKMARDAGLAAGQWDVAKLHDSELVDEEKTLERAAESVAAAVARMSAPQPPAEEVEVVKKAIVIGGGVSGMQAALDIADGGFEVILVEKTSSIGGNMIRLSEVFPTLDCPQCILTPKMVEVAQHPRIKLFPYSEVADISGSAGRFNVKLRRKATSVDRSKCTGCGDCEQNCLVRYKAYPPQEEPSPELSPEDGVMLGNILRRHESKRAPLIFVLQDINEEFRYLPAAILRRVSRELRIPVARILKVATFYSLFSLKPRGKHVISVCEGTTCFVRGSGRLLEEVEKRLGIKPGEVSADGQFSLETVRCIGCCALAPSMRIDQDVHGKVRLTAVGDIIRRYTKVVNLSFLPRKIPGFGETSPREFNNLVN